MPLSLSDTNRDLLEQLAGDPQPRPGADLAAVYTLARHGLVRRERDERGYIFRLTERGETALEQPETDHTVGASPEAGEPPGGDSPAVPSGEHEHEHEHEPVGQALAAVSRLDGPQLEVLERLIGERRAALAAQAEPPQGE